MSKIPSLPLQMESLARCLKVAFFPVPGQVVCSFSNILFDIFGLNTNLAYISKFGEEDLVVHDYLFTSQRESHSVPDRDFLLHYCLFCPHLELSRIELQEFCDYFSRYG